MNKVKHLIIFILIIISLLTISCSNKVDIEYSIHTTLQQQYLNDSYDLFSKYATGLEELSKPNPITFDFSDLSNPTTIKVIEDKVETIYNITNNTLNIYNLKINTKYTYEVYDNNNQVLEKKTFIINDSIIRNLNVDGITNVRDLGGYKTTNKKEVKQGLIYRSSKFNEDESTTILITEDGINTLVNELKLKTELDLRKTSDNENGGLTSSVLGESVKYVSIPMKSNGNCLTLNKNEFKKVFELLGDESNYPIDIHCSIGTDRTGVVCFLINAVLGVQEEDLYRDYLFSNFGYIYDMRTSSAITDYLNTVKKHEGDTLQEQTNNYLISIGVNQSDIDNLRKIMLK